MTARTLDARICYAAPSGFRICGRCLLNQDALELESLPLEPTAHPASACELDPCLTRAGVLPLPPSEDDPPPADLGDAGEPVPA